MSLNISEISTPISQKLYELGKNTYSSSFEESRNYFLGSLYAQLTDLDVLPKAISLDRKIQYHEIVDPIILSTTQDSLIQKVATSRLLLLAQTLRWTGHCYQNIDVYSSAGEENDKRFSFLYGTAEQLLLRDDSQEAKYELAELYYNTGFFLHLRKHSGDYLGACETYEKALALNPSKAMHARVRNMRSILRAKAGETEKADQYKNNVLNPYIEMSLTEKDPFLVAMYHHNFAKLLIIENRLDEAEEALSTTINYMESQERAESPNLHPYFPAFYRTIGELKLLQNKQNEAVCAFTKATEHGKRNPGSYKK